MFGFKRQNPAPEAEELRFHAAFVMPPTKEAMAEIVAEHFDDDEPPMGEIQEKSVIVAIHARSPIEALGIVAVAPSVFDDDEIDRTFTDEFTMEGDVTAKDNRIPLLMAARVYDKNPMKITLRTTDGEYLGGYFGVIPGGDSSSAWQLAEGFRYFITTAEGGHVQSAILTSMEG